MKSNAYLILLTTLVVLSGLVSHPGLGQNALRTRTVVRIDASSQSSAPPQGPEARILPEKAARPAEAQTVKGTGSNEFQYPDLQEQQKRAAEDSRFLKPIEPVMEMNGEVRRPEATASLPKKEAAMDVSTIIANLPKAMGIKNEVPAKAEPLTPKEKERDMALSPYQVADDYSEVFITTDDKPTQRQAERLAALFLGRAPQPEELVLCKPSEGFVLKLSGPLAADAAAREKARALLLAQPDVVTVTPSVTEGPERYYLPGHVLANCRPDMTLGAVRKQLQAHGGQVLEEHDQQTMRVFVIQVPKGADPRRFAETLEKAGLAEEVVPNVQATLKNYDIPNDPSYGSQWWLNQRTDRDIDAQRGWEYFDQQNFPTWVSVCILDGNGYDMNHNDIGSVWNTYNAVSGVSGNAAVAPENASDNHGTPCMGIISANTNNSVGVASVAWWYTYSVPIKIGFNISGGSFSTNSTTISRAATWVIGTARTVATSHSYGGSGTFYSSTVLPYYQNMYNNPRSGKGAVLCAAAGNDNLNNPASYPANYSFAVTVAATDQNDAKAGFSNYGTFLEIAAPGVSILTLDRVGVPGYSAGDYVNFDGTSAACPVVAGVCGAIGRQRSNMSRDSITLMLLTTCDKVGGNVYGTAGFYGLKSTNFGYGRVNMGNAIGRVNSHYRAAPNEEAVLNLICGSTVNGTNSGQSNGSNFYFGTGWSETGPDVNYNLIVGSAGLYTITLSNMSADLDVFLMENEWAGSVIAIGNEVIEDIWLDAGTYTIVVDGYQGAVSSYTLAVRCKFCVPTYTNFNCTSGDYIKSVRINRSVFDSSGCSSTRGISQTAFPYNHQFRTSLFTMYNNANNFMEIHAGVFSQYYAVYLDYDNDGAYEADEKIYASNAPTTKLVANLNASRVNYPAYQYRKLRIISSYSTLEGSTNSCPTLPYGETEDHLVYMSSSGFPIAFGSTGEDYVRGVVRDGSTNLYVSLAYTGTVDFLGWTLTSPSPTRRAMAIAKVNNAGIAVWVKSVGNATFDMEPRGVNVDGAGNPYWAGSFAGSVSFPNGGAGIPLTAAGSHDAFVARFDPATGNCVWARRVGGPGNDYLYGCFVSNSGNVYAGGSYTGAISFPTSGGTIALPNAGGLDGFIVKFDAAGTGLWANRLGSTANDEVKSIEYMGGDLVACGYMGNGCVFPGVSSNITMSTIAASKDGWAARINSTGKFVWVRNFGSTGGDEAMSVCIDPLAGNVFTAAQVGGAMTFNGITHPHQGHNDIAVVGWNFYTVAPIWGSLKGSGVGDVPAAISWDGERLVVAGYAGASFNPGIGTLPNKGGQDALLLRYNRQTGAVSSGLTIGSTGNDQATALWCDKGNREEFVGGIFQNQVDFYTTTPRVSKGLFDGFVSRHFPPSGARMGIEEETIEASANGLKAYPVPVRGMLTVETDQPVTVLDGQGKVMATAMPTAQGQARLDFSALSKGIYLVRTADGRTVKVVKE